MRQVLIGVGLGVVIVAAALWYFVYYDSAEGRCSRGDLGACIVTEL